MTLSQSEIDRLYLEDGLVDGAEIEPGTIKDYDPESDRLLRDQIRQVLQQRDVPDIAGPVMRRIGAVGLPVSRALDEDIVGSETIADAVMERLRVSEPMSGQLKAAVHQSAGEPVSVWSGVAAAIGADVRPSIGDVLRGAVVQEGAYQPVGWATWSKRRWVVPATAGVVVAAAAALLLWVGGSDTEPPRVADKVIVGPVDIEALNVGAANAVQVLEMGEEAPTIILIDPAEAEE